MLKPFVTGRTMMWLLSCLFCGLMWNPANSMVLKVPRNATLDKELLKNIPLSMMPEAVDDMLSGCSKETLDKVVKDFSAKELEKFAKAWKQAAEAAPKKLAIAKAANLTEKQLEAICVYTGDLVYDQFNTAVRTQRKDYGGSFQFHYLYVLLTSAIQTLKTTKDCRTTYRRTKSTFTGTVGQKMRFGTFASTSVKTTLKQFGSQTCFKVQTCLGADVTKFSVYASEEEVLVPPYEQFEITGKKIKGDKDKPAGLEDCENVFELKGFGAKSELNCKLIGK